MEKCFSFKPLNRINGSNLVILDKLSFLYSVGSKNLSMNSDLLFPFQNGEEIENYQLVYQDLSLP